MVEQSPPPDVVDAAVRYLRTASEAPAANGNGGRWESSSERRFLYVALAALGVCALGAIVAALWIGWAANEDRKEARLIDVRAIEEQRCRAAFAEAQGSAEGRYDVAEGVVDDARTQIELALTGTISGSGAITAEAAEALQGAYVDARSAAADELDAYEHATAERDGATEACAADPSIRPTPPPT